MHSLGIISQTKYSITFCKIQHFKLIGLKDILTNIDIFLPFISCNKHKKARGLVVLGEGKGAVML